MTVFSTSLLWGAPGETTTGGASGAFVGAWTEGDLTILSVLLPFACALI